MLTCYDATTAGLLTAGGIDVLLVGDTAAQMILGFDSTLPAEMDFMVTITAAVRRGASKAFVMADMPFGSYQCGENAGVANAIRFVKEAGADAVKLEVDRSMTPLVERMVHAGVPVVAHIGSRPQHIRAKGGYRSAGRRRTEADGIVEDARAMLDAGVAILLIEAVPAEVSRRVVELPAPDPQAPVPVIGCGAGPACHGHVVVLHDLLGLTDWHPPFAPPQADLGGQIRTAAGQWARLVESGQYLKDDHPYRMAD